MAADLSQAISEKYEKLERLGEGTYGIVHRALHKPSNVIVALKVLKLESSGLNGIPMSSLREISLLMGLRHQNIVRLIEVGCAVGNITMVFEYCEMDIRAYCRQHGPLENFHLMATCYQLLQGLAYSHSTLLIHRDIKPQNILVNLGKRGLPPRIKLADFGLARNFIPPCYTHTHEVITIWYRAPEILLGCDRYSTEIDIWSLGCVFAEISKNTPLFPGNSEVGTIFKIFGTLGSPTAETCPELETWKEWNRFPRFRGNKLLTPFLKSMGPLGADVLRATLTYDPRNRPTCVELLRYPWFQELKPSDVYGPGDHKIVDHLS